MLFHGQRTVALAQRRAVFINRTRLSLNTRTFHSSRRCREQYFDATEKTFNDVALNEHASDKVVLVDFHADWCGPCKMVSPALSRLTGDATIKTGSGRSLDLVSIDIDKEIELATKYQIRSIPTVMAFKDGKRVQQFIGAIGEGEIRKFLQRL